MKWFERNRRTSTPRERCDGGGVVRSRVPHKTRPVTRDPRPGTRVCVLTRARPIVSSERVSASTRRVTDPTRTTVPRAQRRRRGCPRTRGNSKLPRPRSAGRWRATVASAAAHEGSRPSRTPSRRLPGGEEAANAGRARIGVQGAANIQRLEPCRPSQWAQQANGVRDAPRSGDRAQSRPIPRGA